MAFGIENLAEQNETRTQEALRQAEIARKEKRDMQALALLLNAIKDIRRTMSSSVKDEITVSNLDEVQAALHNELRKVTKPILGAIDKLSLDRAKIAEIKARVEAENQSNINATHRISIIEKPASITEIANLSDIAFPDNFKVNNLGELQQYFNDLAKVFRESLNIDVKAPIVNVEAPKVTIPETLFPEIPTPQVTVEPTDLGPVVEAIKKLNDRLKRQADKQGKQLMSVSSGLNESSARKAFKQALTSVNDMGVGTAGAKALSDNTVGVALGSAACKVIDITAYGGLISIGDSTSTRVDSSANGVVLTPGSAYYRVFASNLNQVFASGASGARACFVYYN